MFNDQDGSTNCTLLQRDIGFPPPRGAGPLTGRAAPPVSDSHSIHRKALLHTSCTIPRRLGCLGASGAVASLRPGRLGPSSRVFRPQRRSEAPPATLRYTTTTPHAAAEPAAAPVKLGRCARYGPTSLAVLAFSGAAGVGTQRAAGLAILHVMPGASRRSRRRLPPPLPCSARGRPLVARLVQARHYGRCNW